jgi:hypothetical protein
LRVGFFRNALAIHEFDLSLLLGATEAVVVAVDHLPPPSPLRFCSQSARALRTLEDENRKLKKLLAESMLDNAALKELLSKKW